MLELEEMKTILSEGEEIKEYFKPNKKRFVVINSVVSTLFFLIFAGVFLTIGILGNAGVIEFTSTEEGAQPVRDYFTPIMFTIFGGFGLLTCFLTVLGYSIRYKRTLYAVTDKRLIVRSGFIGVDYKSIELKYVGLINVRVDFLDKLVRSNTGTITFASAAIPMTNGQNAANNAFTFKCVDDPYEVYKKVKKYIPNKD